MPESTDAARRPVVAPDINRARPVVWWLLSIPAVVQLFLHVFTNGNYGIFRDEYYYMACANRPAWGYVDQPAFSIWILGVWKAVFGDSVHSIRVLPALCGSGLILLCGAIAAELGGRRWAQLFAGVAAGIGAAGLVMCGFYSMNAYDLLFWSGVYFLLIRILRTGNASWWPTLGLVFGLGLFNKIGLVILGVALVPALLLTKHRSHFLDRRLWMAVAVAVLFAIPYVVWNAATGWPTVEFVNNAKAYKITGMSPLDFLTENVLMANPLTFFLWIAGLVWLFFARGGHYRVVFLAFVFTFVLLVVQRSKPYYLAASFPVLMAVGGVAWERWTRGKWVRWVRWVLLLVLLGGGYVFAPVALPLMEPADLEVYMQERGIAPKAQEVGHHTVLPQYFSDRFGWEELARSVSAVYEGLPEAERAGCYAFAGNYGQAGALEYWSKRYDLPPVFSAHNNYWLWGPPPAGGDVVIVIDHRRETLETFFDRVTLADELQTPHAQEDYIVVWVCRGLKRPVDGLWAEFKHFI